MGLFFFVFVYIYLFLYYEYLLGFWYRRVGKVCEGIGGKIKEMVILVNMVIFFFFFCDLNKNFSYSLKNKTK